MRPLQQALQLEAERGFEDLLGRKERFSSFLQRALAAPPEELDRQRFSGLGELASDFARYGELSQSRRQSLVRRSRQYLFELQKALQPVQPVSPPRLRLLSSETPGAPRSQTIQPDTPLSEVRGVGPKSATRLAALDLWLARDLVRYYPRDYLDYANLVRIAGLEPGKTATIVATVRRSHSFTSPRNPNLSILELHLADITGRIRVSKFFAGKRFSSPAWLKAQQRNYPVGASVAISGLVKETPYGPAFQDPLMEVLESPNASVRSDQIGRLLPVYGLTEGLTAD
ncbi:MAG: DNA helicase RecG, partial [Cyanobacteria bacterium]|nr:DNA helicase RecG [Cyanobacteriota bacterium]